MRTIKDDAVKYSVFTKELTKQLKTSDRIHCQFDEETKEVYMTNGYFLVKLSIPEYDAFVRPVTMQVAGNYVIDHGMTTPNSPMDIRKLLNDTSRDFNHDLARAPFLVEIDKKKKQSITLYYSTHENFVSAFNSAYTAVISDELPCKSKNCNAPAVFFHGETPVAMILPIRLAENKTRIVAAVRAYFSEGEE